LIPLYWLRSRTKWRGVRDAGSIRWEPRWSRARIRWRIARPEGSRRPSRNQWRNQDENKWTLDDTFILVANLDCKLTFHFYNLVHRLGSAKNKKKKQW